MPGGRLYGLRGVTIPSAQSYPSAFTTLREAYFVQVTRYILMHNWRLNKKVAVDAALAVEMFDATLG